MAILPFAHSSLTLSSSGTWNSGSRRSSSPGSLETCGERSRRESRVPRRQRWEPEEEASIRELVAELGTTRAGKGGKPDRVSVSAKNWAVISERLGTGRSTGAVRQHWDIMNGKREKSGKKAAKAGRAAARGASYGYN